MNLATLSISQQSCTYSISRPCSVVSAQRHGAGHVLLVSRGSQQRAFIEAGTASPMTCMKAGARNMWTQIPPYHLGSQPAGAPRKPRARTRTLSLLRRAAAKVWLHRAGALRNLSPSAEPHMLICTAERSAPAEARAGPRLGLGQILLLSKNTTVHGCVLLRWLHLADWL